MPIQIANHMLHVSGDVIYKYVWFSLGTNVLIEQHPQIAEEEALSSDEQLCRKDTGGRSTLRKWSRGHQFIVRGGGHIDTWQPLYM